MTRSVLVWDLPTRVFHWSLVLSFIGAFVTSESERYALLHVTFGYTVLGLIVFRVIWGLTGTRYARFSEFVKGPSALCRHVLGMLRGCPDHYIGHNPVGAFSILALLLLGLASTISGWAIYDDVGGGWLEQVHEWASDLMLAFVLVHIVGVLVSSRLQKENLVAAMINGRKQAEDNQAIPGNYPRIAMLLLTALIGFWIWSWSASKLISISSNYLELLKITIEQMLNKFR